MPCLYFVHIAIFASYCDLQRRCLPCATEFHHSLRETRKVYKAGTVKILTWKTDIHLPKSSFIFLVSHSCFWGFLNNLWYVFSALILLAVPPPSYFPSSFVSSQVSCRNSTCFSDYYVWHLPKVSLEPTVHIQKSLRCWVSQNLVIPSLAESLLPRVELCSRLLFYAFVKLGKWGMKMVALPHCLNKLT